VLIGPGACPRRGTPAGERGLDLHDPGWGEILEIAASCSPHCFFLDPISAIHAVTAGIPATPDGHWLFFSGTGQW